MAGYRIVFNREKMVLGWSPSDCECHFTSKLFVFMVSFVCCVSEACFLKPGYDNGAGTPYGYTTPFDSPPTDKSPPSDDSPPAPVTPGGSTGLPNIEVGVATRLNPLTSVFVAVLAILAVVGLS